jgi:hypothetical protein
LVWVQPSTFMDVLNERQSILISTLAQDLCFHCIFYLWC